MGPCPGCGCDILIDEDGPRPCDACEDHHEGLCALGCPIKGCLNSLDTILGALKKAGEYITSQGCYDDAVDLVNEIDAILKRAAEQEGA